MNVNKRAPFAVVVALLLAACGRSVEEPAANGARAGAANPLPAAPTANQLLALDRQANEAFFRGDASHFERLLGNRFVMLGPGGARLDKEATVGMVSRTRCDMRDGWSLDEPRLSSVDADTFVLTYRGTFDGTCTFDGETEKAPSPVRAATVWVRSGESWRAAFHGENPIFDPRAPQSPPTEPAAATGATSASEGVAAATPQGDRAADPIADALLQNESYVWIAWKDRDAGALEELTAKELAFVDIFGNVTSGKAETLRFWAEQTCDVQGVRVENEAATALSATVGILTFTGILEGTCGGQKFPEIRGTSVYAKEGEDWKLAFTMNQLAN